MFQYHEPNLNFYLLFVKAWYGYDRIWKKNPKHNNGSYFHDWTYLYCQEAYIWINITKFLSNTHFSIKYKMRYFSVTCVKIHLQFLPPLILSIYYKFLKRSIKVVCFNRKWHISIKNHFYLTSETRFYMLFFKAGILKKRRNFRGSNLICCLKTYTFNFWLL